jgi:hypothetical protein
MCWCELNGVDYLFGLAKDARLKAAIVAELDAARQHSERTDSEQTGRPARRFKNFTWSTPDSGSPFSFMPWDTTSEFHVNAGGRRPRSRGH